MSRRSRMSCQPMLMSNVTTLLLATGSLPQTSIVGLPPFAGSTMTSQFTIFNVFTTLACGAAFCTSSPSEFVLQIESDGGIPCEKSSGLLTSTSTLPASAGALIVFTTSRKTSPFRQIKTISPNAAASLNVPCDAFDPVAATHFAALSLFAVREPIFTACPSFMNFVPSASPTIPVPSIPIFIDNVGRVVARGRFLLIYCRHTLLPAHYRRNQNSQLAGISLKQQTRSKDRMFPIP